MAKKRLKIRETWDLLRKSGRFHTFLTFLIFVGIAAFFWMILALNDNIQDDLEIKVSIENKPDSVTFITEPATHIHVIVRDKGSSLWRAGVMSKPTLSLNFRDQASDGIFRVSRNELTGAVKSLFGSNATIISVSPDSLRYAYTTLPGKRVPVDLACKVSAVSGKVISSRAADPSYVTVYSTRDILDTLTRVFTENVSRRNLDESTQWSAKLRQIPGVRIIPDKVTVKIGVEPLVKKESSINVKIEQLPLGYDLLLFPAKVKVNYYLPMGKFSDETPEIDVWVDYSEVRPGAKSLKLHCVSHSADIVNLTLAQDSVEYILVKE